MEYIKLIRIIKKKCDIFYNRYHLNRYIEKYNEKNITNSVYDEIGIRNKLYDFMIRRAEEFIHNKFHDFTDEELEFLNTFDPLSEKYDKLLCMTQRDIMKYIKEKN